MTMVPATRGNPLFAIADRMHAGNRRSAEFSQQVAAHVGILHAQAGISEQAAHADHGRHLELLGALQSHELATQHAQHTHEVTLAAAHAKADVSRINAGGRQAVAHSKANWEGANEMTRTLGSFSPDKAREAMNPMDPPAQPQAPTIATPGSESPAAEKPKRTRAKKSAAPEGTLF